MIRLVVTSCVGLALMATSWYQVTGASTVRDQLTWFNVGLAGLGLAAAANGLWLYSGRRQIGLARMAIIPSAAAVIIETPTLRHGDSPLFFSEGMSFYHDADCVFVRGRRVRPAGDTSLNELGLRPCNVCLPHGATSR